MKNDRIISGLKKIQSSLLIFLCDKAYAQKLVLDNKMHHIRQGNMQEWEEFDKHPEGNRLVVHFSARTASKGNMNELIKKLASFDEAVATFGFNKIFYIQYYYYYYMGVQGVLKT